MKTIRYTDKQIADALAVTGGDITASANALHCSRETVQKRIQKSPSLQAALSSEREKVVDLAVSELVKLIRDGHFPSIRFVLTTWGKSRGFVEQSDLDVSGASKINVVISKEDAKVL